MSDNTPRWIKIYFNRDQYDEWRSGNGRAIGYTENMASDMKMMEHLGLLDFGLKDDPLDHMTKVPPHIVTTLDWAGLGVYVGNMDRRRLA